MQFDSIRFDFDFLGCLFVCLFVCSIPWWSIIWLWIEISSWLVCLFCQCSCFFFFEIPHWTQKYHISVVVFCHHHQCDLCIEKELMIIIGQFEFVSIQINSIMMMMMMTTMIYKYKWMNKKTDIRTQLNINFNQYHQLSLVYFCNEKNNNH